MLASATRTINFKLDQPSRTQFEMLFRLHVVTNLTTLGYTHGLRSLFGSGAEGSAAIKGALVDSARKEVERFREEIDAKIKNTQDEQELRRLKKQRAEFTMKGEVSQNARNWAKPLTDPASEGAGKGGPLYTPEEVLRIRAELENDPSLITTTYKASFFAVKTRLGFYLTRENGEVMLHPDLRGKTLAQWPAIWSEHKRGAKAKRDLEKKFDERLNGVATRAGTPLEDYAKKLGSYNEGALFAPFVNASRNLASNASLRVNQKEENKDKVKTAQEREERYNKDPNWALVQELEKELHVWFEETSGNRSKGPYRIAFRALKGCRKVFRALQALVHSEKEPTEEHLIDAVKGVQKELTNFGSFELYARLCQKAYWSLWDARGIKKEDRGNKRHNWVIRRAEYNEDCEPYATPRLTYPDPFMHPLWAQISGKPKSNVWKADHFDLLTGEVSMTILWRGKEHTLSFRTLPNNRLQQTDGKTFLLRGDPKSKTFVRRRNEASVSTSYLRFQRKDLLKFRKHLPDEVRNLIRPGSKVTSDLVDAIVKACGDTYEDLVAKKKAPSVFLAVTLDLEKKVTLQEALTEYQNEIWKSKPNEEKIKGLAESLDGLLIKGIDAGVRNSGGVAVVCLVAPSKQVPAGFRSAVLPGGLKAYVRASEVLYLPQENKDKSSAERRVGGIIDIGRRILNIQSLLFQAYFTKSTLSEEDQKKLQAFLEAEKLDVELLDSNSDVQRGRRQLGEAPDLLTKNQVVEELNRAVLGVLRQHLHKLSADRRTGKGVSLGGKSDRRIQLLVDRLDYEKAYAQRSYISAKGKVVPGIKNTFNLGHIQRLSTQIRNLKEDRALQHVAETRKFGGDVALVAIEDLDSFTKNAERSRGENRRLDRWRHPFISERQKQYSEITGERLTTVMPRGTSRFHSLDLSPGIRIGKITPFFLKKKWMIQLMERYDLRLGDLAPMQGGEDFLTLNKEGGLVQVKAETNAAEAIALKAVRSKTEEAYLECKLVEGEYFDAQGFQMIPQEDSHEGFVRSAKKSGQKLKDGVRVFFCRDITANFSPADRWFPTPLFWQMVEKKIFTAYLQTVRKDQAAE